MSLHYLSKLNEEALAIAKLVDPVIKVLHDNDLSITNMPKVKELAGANFKLELYLNLTEREFLSREDISRLAKWDKYTKLFTAKHYRNYYTDHVRPFFYSGTMCKVELLTAQPGTVFIYDQVSKDAGIIDYPKMGYLCDEIKYLQLSDKKGNCWMSITQNEINTMWEPLERCHGNVITFGLGLGYFTMMAAGKCCVDKVTVVENDPEIIHIFNTYVLPSFPKEVRDKVHVIEDDALKFLREVKDGDFDYHFVDLWKSLEDMELFLKCVAAAKHLDQSKVDFWIETAMLYVFRQDLFCCMLEDMILHPEQQLPLEKVKKALDLSLMRARLLKSE